MAEVSAKTVTTETVSTTEVMTATVKATAAATMAATEATSGRRNGGCCGRSERNDDENKFTKHFNLLCAVRMHRFNGAKLWP
jgi:hypothetical protein